MREMYTLDQNYFRSAELKQMILDRPTAKFVIPDVALLEMCKGPKWRETMQGSLEALLPIPGRVSVSLSRGVAFAKECADLKSIDGKMVDKEFTKVLRLSMNDLKTGVDSNNGLGLIAAHVQGVQLDLQQHELNHENNKKNFLERDNLLREALGSRASKELRQGAPDEHRLAVIHSMAVQCATGLLRKGGASDARIKGFLRTRPLVLRYFLSAFWHSMEWVSKGGIHSRSDADITNDMLDQDYVIVASFFGQLLTKDRTAAKAYVDMNQLLKM